MKRNILYFLTIFLLTICLFGCVPMNMNNVVKEPNFTGLVEEVYENTIIVKVNEKQGISSDLVSVNTKTKLKDSIRDFEVGQQVRVYYNGIVAESYPAQVNTVYAIVIVISD